MLSYIIILTRINNFFCIYSSIKSEDEYYDKDDVATKEETIEQPEAEPTVPSEEDHGDNESDKTMDAEPRENRDEGSVSTELANDGLKEKDGNSSIERYEMVDLFFNLRV